MFTRYNKAPMVMILFMALLLAIPEAKANDADLLTAPEVTTRLTENFDLEMPTLKAYPI